MKFLGLDQGIPIIQELPKKHRKTKKIINQKVRAAKEIYLKNICKMKKLTN
jgi:hypothetical protein